MAAGQMRLKAIQSRELEGGGVPGAAGIYNPHINDEGPFSADLALAKAFALGLACMGDN